MFFIVLNEFIAITFIFYLRQGGYVIIIVSLCVCEQLCAKTSQWICMKFSGQVGQ